MKLLIAFMLLLLSTAVLAEPHKPLSDEEYAALPKQMNVLREQGENEKLRLLASIFVKENRYRPVRGIHRFVKPLVTARPSTFLDTDSLSSYISMRFLNSFSFLQTNFQDASIHDPLVGWFTCHIMTAGQDYPVAYHVRCTGGPMTDMEHWHDETLGFDHERSVEDDLKKAMDRHLEDFAIFVLKAKGKM